MKNRLRVIWCILCIIQILHCICSAITIDNQFDKVQYQNIATQRQSLFSDGVTPVCKDNLWGYVNTEGEMVVPFMYEEAHPFEQKIACVRNGEKQLVIDLENEIICDLSTYDSITNAGNGLIIVEENGLFGLVDLEGNIQIIPEWDSIMPAGEGPYIVTKDNLYGYLDASGQIILPVQYKYAEPFSSDVAYVQTTNGEHCLIDRDGQILAKQVYSSLVNGLAMTQQDGKWGFVNAKGEIVIACIWDDVQLPSEGKIAVCKNDVWGFMDTSGEIVIEPRWQFVWNFSNGIAIIGELSQRSGKIDRYGFIDENGTEIVAPQYGRILSFTDAWTPYLDSETMLWGYLDKSGTRVVEPRFQFATVFSNGYALVQEDRYFLIDMQYVPATATTEHLTEYEQNDLKQINFHLKVVLYSILGIIFLLILFVGIQCIWFVKRRKRLQMKYGRNRFSNLKVENSKQVTKRNVHAEQKNKIDNQHTIIKK